MNCPRLRSSLRHPIIPKKENDPAKPMCPSNKREREKMAINSTRCRRHRVLIYTSCYNVIDGVTLTIRKIEQEILSSGGHVCIVTTRGGNDSLTNMDGLSHPNRRVIFLDNSVIIPFSSDLDNPDTTYQIGFSLSSSVLRQVDEFAPSIIHITVPDFTGLCMIEYGRRFGIPLMGTYHSNLIDYMDHYPGMGWFKPILLAYMKHNYNFLQALYVPTPFIRRHLCDSYKLDSSTNLRIWGRGIDLSKFSPCRRSLEFRQRLGISPTEVVVCFAGRLVPEKRPDIFARVIRRLHKEGINFRALVIGSGPYENEIKKLPRTIFGGWMSGAELAEAYASCDIFLFPSAVETFGNVTLEAAASGLPLVVESGCSGHLVNHGVNGYACLKDDEDSFYNATLSLILDNDKRKTFSENSRCHSLLFEQDHVLKKMLSNYTEITNDFYKEYGGQHCNRDTAWVNKGSFHGGTATRPFTLKIVVCLAVFIFRLGWLMFSCYSILSKKIRGCQSLQKYKSQNRCSVDDNALSQETIDFQNHLQHVSVTFAPNVVESDQSTMSERSSSQGSISEHSTIEEPIIFIPVGDRNCTRIMAVLFTKAVMTHWRIEEAITRFVKHRYQMTKYEIERFCAFVWRDDTSQLETKVLN